MSIFSVNPTVSGIQGGQYFQIGRVKSIVLGPFKGSTKERDPDYTNPSDIGKIRYELLYSTFNTSFSEAVSEPALPIFNFVKQYPTINEIVLIIAGPTEKLNDKVTNQQFFYFPAYNLWNSPIHGAFPNMNEYKEFLSQYINQPSYSGQTIENAELPLGYTFRESGSIKNLQPFEGDLILQSRFGQSIRFGSTVPELKTSNNWSSKGNSGDPITIITNKQSSTNASSKFDTTIEDINKDGASIWMTSTQEIYLEDINNFPLKSFETKIDVVSQPILQIPRLPILTQITSPTQQDQNSAK